MGENIRIDATDGVSDILATIARQMALLNNSFATIESQVVKFNAAGKATQATMKGMNAAGQELNTTVRVLKGGYLDFNTAVKENVEASKKAAAVAQRQKFSQDQLAASIRASVEVFKALREQITSSQLQASGASPLKIINLQKAEADLTKLTRLSGLTSKQVLADLERVRNGFRLVTADKSYLTALQRVAEAQRAVGVAGQAGLSKVQKATERANKATKEFTLSWASLGRIVTIQLLRRALFSFTNSLRDSIKEAIQLSKRVAELQTISQNAQLTTDEWSASLVDLSESFGLTILDTTEAAYQTLSNQVAEGAETFDFLSTAAAFSVTTLTSATDSVNLLTAALNAYGKGTEEAEHVAATLFKTIELGRIRGGELSNTFGRIAVLGNQLGVSLEGLEAFLAIVTIRGVKTSEAMTQIRGVFNKLLRPTEDMKDLFRELGVESAEQLFKTRSLVEVFQVLAEKTQGSSTELGKLFPRVRGITGAMIGAIASTGEFGEKLDEIRNGSEAFAKAQKLVLESSGKVVEIELQKIKNFFTVTFGTTVVDILADVNKHIVSLSGTVEFLAQAITIALVPATVALSAALIKLALSNPFTAAIVGVALLTSAIIQLVREAEQAEIEAQKRIEEAISKRVKKAVETEQRATRLIIDEIDARVRVEEKASRDIIGSLNDLADDQADVIKNLNKIIKDDFDDTISALKDGIRDLASEQKDVVNRFEELSKFEVDIAETIREQIFDDSLDRLNNIGDKLLLFQREIQETAKRINLAVTTGDDSLFRDAISDLNKLTVARVQLARKAQKDREKIAGEITEKEAKLALDLANLQERQEAARRVRNFKQAENFKRRERDLETKREREILKLRTRLNDLQNQDIDKFADNFEQQYSAILQITKAGVDELQAQQLKKALELAQKESDFRIILKKQEIAAEEFARFKPESLEDAETPEALDRIFQRRLNNINSLLTVTRELQGVQESVSNAKRIENLEILKAATITQRTAAFNAAQLESQIKERTLTQSDLKDALKDLGAKREILQTVNATVEALKEQITTTTLQATLDAKLANAKKRLDVGSTTLEQLKPIRELLGASQAAITAFQAFKQTGLASDAKTFSEAVQTLQKTIGAVGGSRGLGFEGFPGLQSFVTRGLQLSNLISGFNIAGSGAAEIADELITTKAAEDGVVAALQLAAELQKNIAQDTEKQETSLEKINRLTKTFIEQVQAEQILRNAISPNAFARGGHVASSDRVNALLSPGEFVVNARSARKFHSQLVGMNSGFAHGGRVSGGDTVNVGGISINGFQPSGSIDSQAIALGKSLRRQIKRKTVRLT